MCIPNRYCFFGVNDGHGVGSPLEVAKACAEALPKNIAKHLPGQENKEEIQKAITKGFRDTEQYLKTELLEQATDAGCTAIIAVLTPSGQLYAVKANIEDSPGFILSNRILSLQITKEHDVHNKERDGDGFSISRLAPERREKSWA
ncbi:23098_t:CDS:2, partial [Gigaspora margarita]